MAVTAFARLRMLWGAVDWQSGSGNPYSTAQTASGGTSAAAGSGIGVRRCVLVFDRTAGHAGADNMEMHFDFLNITGGTPDDTWITSDYTTLEGYLATWMTAVKPYIATGDRLIEYAWYRVGSGVTAPNPAERVNVLGSPVSGTGNAGPLPPQVACSITFRTAVRKSWGRTYLPWRGGTMGGDGTFPTASVDVIRAATVTMVNSAASSDFYLVVVSKTLSASLNVEHIEVDNNPDVIRRRRWKTATYKTIV